MKEKIRTLLLQNPDITLPAAARTLGKNSQNDKSFGIAYWQARALLMEELTGKTIRTLLEDTDRKDLTGKSIRTLLDEGHMGHKDLTNEGHKDLTNEGPFAHAVSIYDF